MVDASSLSNLIIGASIGLILVAVYIGIAEIIKRKKVLSNYIEIGLGDILWVKFKNTRFIDILSNPKKLYTVGSTLGLAAGYILMIFATTLVLFAAYLSIITPQLPDITTAPNNILFIPGVSDFVPLTVEVILAMIIAITTHEVAHGILARIHGVEIKSIGMMGFVIPLGGFVEPDEEQVNALPLMKRLQIYAAGISANLVALFISWFSAAYLISLTTGVSLIKTTIPETATFFGQVFISLVKLPMINVVSPSPQTLWLTQNTITWMPTHVEPFIGYWFMLHLMVWTFWISFALVLTNILPLKVTDGGKIFEDTTKYLLDKVNLGRYAVKISDNIALVLFIGILGVFFIPYIYQIIS
jgi:membrane-associated protease RseP (regulator of RpoE activity)